MWKNKKVSVIFPTYNEKDSIKKSIEDFFRTGLVDEILVVNNNAAEGTDTEVAKTRARQVFEKKQGYGHAIIRGFKEVKGDLIIVSEPDGTFLAEDVLKLLAYSDDCSAVFCSRTNKSLILKDANMGHFLKWGNFFVAKMCEVLFNTTYLSDVGCTMRLIKRKALGRIQKKFVTGGSHFGLEMMLLTFTNRISYVQIPINYNKRVGESSVTGDFWKALYLGFTMIAYVLRFRIKSLFVK